MTTTTHLDVPPVFTERPGLALLLETRLALGPRHAAPSAESERDAHLLILARRLVHDLAGPHLDDGDPNGLCPGCCCQHRLRRECPVRGAVRTWLASRPDGPSILDLRA
jgi:hypothetical protein